MLGWHVFVNKESEVDPAGQSMVSWNAGIDGLSWLDELVRQGLVKDLGGSGYPNKYSGLAYILLPQIVPSITSYDEKLVVSDDSILESTENLSIKINKSKIETCKPDDQLIIEIWDMS